MPARPGAANREVARAPAGRAYRPKPLRRNFTQKFRAGRQSGQHFAGKLLPEVLTLE
jgi:hypothetical protein